MRATDIPVVGTLLAWGADDRVFDLLLVLGPLLVLAIAVGGRHPLLVAASFLYVLAFLLRVATNGVGEAAG